MNKFRKEISCLIVYWLCCVICSIAPAYLPAWWLENGTVWTGIIFLSFLYYKGVRLRMISLLIILAASCLHTIGGHYTFAYVPYGECIGDLFGVARNCYDRLGHLFCGLLAVPLMDVLLRNRVNPVGTFVLGVLSVMGAAAMYEMFEWWSTTVLDKQTAEVYVAIQGDPWDAQADMLMCFIGTLLSVLIACFAFRKTEGDEGVINLFECRK